MLLGIYQRNEIIEFVFWNLTRIQSYKSNLKLIKKRKQGNEMNEVEYTIAHWSRILECGNWINVNDVEINRRLKMRFHSSSIRAISFIANIYAFIRDFTHHTHTLQYAQKSITYSIIYSQGVNERLFFSLPSSVYFCCSQCCFCANKWGLFNDDYQYKDNAFSDVIKNLLLFFISNLRPFLSQP